MDGKINRYSYCIDCDFKNIAATDEEKLNGLSKELNDQDKLGYLLNKKLNEELTDLLREYEVQELIDSL